ncbi:MAG: PsiF family protein [Alphaproteobacteria bacterium]|nr:PsiF family protein [Alphaproteobacteria bacterium]
MKIMASLLIAGALVLSFGPSGYAQMTTPAAPTAPTAPTMPSTPSMPSAGKAAGDAAKAAKAKECSTQADAQGLHGKERKAFRAKCKAGKT